VATRGEEFSPNVQGARKADVDSRDPFAKRAARLQKSGVAPKAGVDSNPNPSLEDYPKHNTSGVCCSFFWFLCFQPLAFIFFYHAFPTTVVLVAVLWGLIALTPWLFHAGGAAGSDFSGPCLTVMMFFSVTLSFLASVHCYYSHVQPMRSLIVQREYSGVYPSLPAIGFPDAAYVKFAGGAKVERDKAVSIKSLDSGASTYCAAPVSNAASHGRYEFWAIGLDCCGDKGDKFDCDDAKDLTANTGWVLPKNHDALWRTIGKYVSPHNIRRDIYVQALHKAEHLSPISTPGNDAVLVRWTKKKKWDIVKSESWAIGLTVLIVVVNLGLLSFQMTRLYQRFKYTRQMHRKQHHMGLDSADMDNTEEEDFTMRIAQFVGKASPTVRIEGWSKNNVYYPTGLPPDLDERQLWDYFDQNHSSVTRAWIRGGVGFVIFKDTYAVDRLIPLADDKPSRMLNLSAGKQIEVHHPNFKPKPSYFDMFLMGVLVPYLSLMGCVVLSSFAFCWQSGYLISTFFYCMLSIFIVAWLATPNRTVTGLFVLLVSVNGSWIGHVNYRQNMYHYCSVGDRRTYENVRADSKTDEFRDAGKLRFESSVQLRTDLSVGFFHQDITYCAAPVISSTAPCTVSAAPENQSLPVLSLPSSSAAFMETDPEETPEASAPLSFMQQHRRHKNHRARSSTAQQELLGAVQSERQEICKKPAPAQIEWWAIGKNCCDKRGKFWCDGGDEAGARSAVVLRPYGDEDQGNVHLNDRRHFYQAINQSVAVYDLPQPERAVLLRWGKSADDLQLDWEERAIGTVILTGIVSFLIIFLVGIASFCYTRQLRSTEMAEKQLFESRRTPNKAAPQVLDSNPSLAPDSGVLRQSSGLEARMRQMDSPSGR
jgi:hypothetical protein